MFYHLPDYLSQLTTDLKSNNKEQMKSITKMLDEVQSQLQREAAERKLELETRLSPPPPPLPPIDYSTTPDKTVSANSAQLTTQSLDELSSDENDGDDESIGSNSKYYRRQQHHQAHQSLRRSTTNSIRANRRRLRWQSFYNDHQPSFRSRPIQLSSLSAGQVSQSIIFDTLRHLDSVISVYR